MTKLVLLIMVIPVISIFGAMILTPSGPTTIIEAPLFSRMPPAVSGGDGQSQMWMVFLAVVCRIICGTGAGGASAMAGTVPVSQKPPLQIGLSASPSSNSTQTFASGGGTA